jgi:RNA polymerase sigma-70 factor, ECF subfamily
VLEDRRLCEPKVKDASAHGERSLRNTKKRLRTMPGLSGCATVGDVLGAEFSTVVAQARGGDDTGFARLWRDLQPALLRYLRVAAPSFEEDLASETWLRVSQGLDRFEGDEPGFRAWVFTIARHRVLDWRRRVARSRAATVPSEQLEQQRGDDDPAADALDLVTTDAALALIAELPTDQAEVVMLRAVAGLDVRRVARIVGKRPGTVRVLAHRGLRRLAELLADDEPARGDRVAEW